VNPPSIPEPDGPDVGKTLMVTGDSPPAPGRLTVAERAYIRAAKVWGPASDRDEAEAEVALDELRRLHSAQARPSREDVHPSWWVRALKEESAAVQNIVAEYADPTLHAVLCRGLGLDAGRSRADTPLHPEAVQWALALWGERLVGDAPAAPDDPPVVIALGRLDLGELITLIQEAGLGKLSLMGTDSLALPSSRRTRFEYGRREEPRSDEWSAVQAARDYRHFLRGKGWGANPGRGRSCGRFGLLTIGRLLAHVEPYRTRWALQHLPYGIARRVRPLIRYEGAPIADWEGHILRTAWDGLAHSGDVRSTSEVFRP
jgi:hypothetical protein